MATIDSLPLVVITGPTASGKTALAIQLAKEYGGEIICADSRTVYRRMDIGTAKPTREERQEVPHWGIDIVDPDQSFTAADFKMYAIERIAAIRARGRIPFLVGGTGLYIDAVVFDYQFGPPANVQRRAELEKLSLEELHIYCNQHNIMLPQNSRNKRYVIRAIEQKGVREKRRATPIENTYIVAIATDREVLRARIRTRSEQLFQDGVVEEARLLGKKYGWNHESMTGNIYPLVYQYLHKTITETEMQQMFQTLDWRLAKRQLTWLKRNQFAKWLSLEDARDYLVQVLANRS